MNLSLSFLESNTRFLVLLQPGGESLLVDIFVSKDQSTKTLIRIVLATSGRFTKLTHLKMAPGNVTHILARYESLLNGVIGSFDVHADGSIG